MSYLGCEMVQGCNWSAAQSLAKKLHVLPLNILSQPEVSIKCILTYQNTNLYNHDLHLVKEVSGQV